MQTWSKNGNNGIIREHAEGMRFPDWSVNHLSGAPTKYDEDARYGHGRLAEGPLIRGLSDSTMADDARSELLETKSH